MCSWVLGDSESLWWCIQFLQWALHLEKLSNTELSVSFLFPFMFFKYCKGAEVH